MTRSPEEPTFAVFDPYSAQKRQKPGESGPAANTGNGPFRAFGNQCLVVEGCRDDDGLQRRPQSTVNVPIRRYRPQASRIVGTIMPIPVGGDRKIKLWYLKR